jgi:hypothetical protein
MTDDDREPTATFRPPGHWALDLRVNVAHILTTLALAGSLAVYVSKMEARLTVLEEHRNMQLARDLRQDSDYRDLKADITATFKELRDEIRGLRDDLSGRNRR